MRRPDSSSAVDPKDAAFNNLSGEGRAPLGASQVRAPVAKRHAFRRPDRLSPDHLESADRAMCGLDQHGGPEGRSLQEPERRREGPLGREPGPNTSGAAPSGREQGGEQEPRNRPPVATPPQEPRGRERPGIESRGPRSQSFGGERGATERPVPPAPFQRPAERSPSPGIEAPRSRGPELPRPQSPATTGAAPERSQVRPGGPPGRREER
jgi:hypothetical protein